MLFVAVLRYVTGGAFSAKSRGNRILMICSNASAIVKDGLVRQWLTSTPVTSRRLDRLLHRLIRV